MAAIGVQGSPHYYLTLDGTIYQLVDEQDASWHSGMATLGGLWFDTNRLSIGIALQRVPLSLEGGEDLGEPVEENPRAQIDALRWLLRDLVRRYRLSPDDVVLADSLVSSVETIPGALLLTEVFEREA
jgi:N-acetyl-anhydromuramyl-L-alanine amidase AmpD